MRLGLVKVLAALSLAAVPGAAARDPVPLQGVPLREQTGVRLVVNGNRPFVLDLDTGRVTPVRGIPAFRRGFVAVVGIAGRAAVVMAGQVRRQQLYGIRDKGLRVSRLGTGADVAPAGDGRSVWVKRVVRRSRCTLRRVRLDGRVLRAPKAFRCGWRIYAGGSLGLGVKPTRVIDPMTGRAVFRTRLGIVAVAGKTVVLRGGPGGLTLVETATGARRRAEWPDTGGSLGWAAVDVRGRFVALGFGNPSWTPARGGKGQYFDVWVLDTETAKLRRLPDMPAFVALKGTDMAWTEDGRLVLLADSLGMGKDIVGLWRPGQERVKVKTLRLPDLSASSPRLAPLG